MDKEIDARGLSCPMPLIETKKALEEMEEGSVRTLVDSETAKENLTRFAQSMQYPFKITEGPGFFSIDIFKEFRYREMTVEDLGGQQTSVSDLVILITKDTLGEGSEELGRILMKGYLHTLTEVLPLPRTLIFLNSGVRLTCEGAEELEPLRRLERKGVELISCGTCLDYFKLKSTLVVGGVGNMYQIVERMNQAKNTLQL